MHRKLKAGLALQILIRLLVLYVNPASEPAASARQCLSVFFPAYAGFSARHHLMLCQAIIPAARRALLLGNSAACKAAAANLLRFSLQLLQVETFYQMYVLQLTVQGQK